MLEILENRLKELGKVAIAYSGGIDSCFLLYAANQVLPKENVMAVIAKGNMMPLRDYDEAVSILRENSFNYREIPYNPLDITEFRENRKDRCYHCKRQLMTKIKETGNENGFVNILDGKNADDLKAYRPGNKAAEELKIISPLAELGIDKETIRNEAKKLGIRIWNKPSNSCLATRFPYNTDLTDEKLKKAEWSEEIIKSLGIEKARVRIHNNIARIEVEKQDFERVLKSEKAVEKIKELGFDFVTLDLSGIKSGNFD